MFVKRIKRVCGVRGCKNTDVFAISKSKDMGNSVIACKDCLKEALASIETYVEPPKVIREIKPLFYHPETKDEVTLSSVTDIEPKPQEVIEEVAEDIPIVAEDTVTTDIAEEKPIIKAPEKPKPTNTVKKKPNKKK